METFFFPFFQTLIIPLIQLNRINRTLIYLNPSFSIVDFESKIFVFDNGQRKTTS